MPPRTLGIEEELLIVDAETGRPLGVSAPALSDAARHGWAVEGELFQQQLEIASEPRADLADARADLAGRRAEAGAAAAAAGGAVVAAIASSPVSAVPTVTDKKRYAEMAERFGLLAHEQLTCGCHVHVQVDSPEEGVGVLDRIRPWLPVLVALSANSPFWQEQDSGYASYRRQVWGRWPSAGPTELFGSVSAYRATVEAMLATGTILDPGMVYFDARLSANFPTVETRVADVCLHLDDAVLIAALVRGLVETAAQEWRDDVPPDPVRMELLRLAYWRAARSGLGGDLLDPRTGRPTPAHEVVDVLLDHVGAALDAAGDTEVVTTAWAQLRERGTGADRQRQARDAGGWEGVVSDAAGITLESGREQLADSRHPS